MRVIRTEDAVSEARQSGYRQHSAAWQEAGGKTAKELGISKATLWRKIKNMGWSEAAEEGFTQKGKNENNRKSVCIFIFDLCFIWM